MLALLGGTPIRSRPMPRGAAFGAPERAAALAVLEGGVLSSFLGEPGEAFFGGPEVRSLELEFARHFHVAHAVSTNSATTALHSALGAIGVGPGDEVIVSPFTMSATAAVILMQNAVPVFADIDPVTFCLDPRSVRRLVGPQTRAIMVVDIFGQPAHWDELRKIAQASGLPIIEDAAQAAGASYRGRPAGTLGDIGVLSLNYHKIIHTGEGGVMLTDAPEFATRAQLIRNHGEVVVESLGMDPGGIIGSNYRMTELHAAIARVQLTKLQALFAHRAQLGDRLAASLRGLPGITPPTLDDGATSTYYGFAVKLDTDALGVSRHALVRALVAEGVPFSEGYVRPLYLQPMYQHRVARGRSGCPWTCGHYQGEVDYAPGMCPVAERMHGRELIVGDFGAPDVSAADVDDVARAFEKVLEALGSLREWEDRGKATSDAAPRA